MIIMCMSIGTEEVCKISSAENASPVIPTIDRLLTRSGYKIDAAAALAVLRTRQV